MECIGSTNLTAIQECLSYLDDLPYEVIVIALQKTAEVNGNWKYAKTILNSWVNAKIDTVEKVKAEEQSFKNKKTEKQKDEFDQQEEYRKFLEETDD